MDQRVSEANLGKFIDPDVTADGSARARVALSNPRTLWFNTGTLCNIACVNCYIESSPHNDRLAYLRAREVSHYLDQITARAWPVEEIGFTGGEPFMNPEFLTMLGAALAAGYEVLVLTNAMQPMQRPGTAAGLARLIEAHGGKLTLRISLDHWTRAGHDAVRGAGSWDKTLEGMRWLRDRGASLNVAGRALWHESEAEARAGFADLFTRENFKINAQDPAQTVIFPEMDMAVEVPEITNSCWGILEKSPRDVMCSSSRMVVRRKGAAHASVLACTLLAYDEGFELGETLEEAEADVPLNHPHCAKFCVLGGASCSA